MTERPNIIDEAWLGDALADAPHDIMESPGDRQQWVCFSVLTHFFGRDWMRVLFGAQFSTPIGGQTPRRFTLVVERGKSKRTNKFGTREGYHYQIEPRTRMTVAAYKGALDNFARNAIAKHVGLAKDP